MGPQSAPSELGCPKPLVAVEQLSIHSAQPGVEALPVEVWTLIFGHFRQFCYGRVEAWEFRHEESTVEKKRKRADIQALKNLRLTCRTFNSLVTPLLFRIVELDISLGSLERLEAICETPLIAAAIRGVQVDLSYCAGDISSSSDYDIFLDLQLRKLAPVTSGKALGYDKAEEHIDSNEALLTCKRMVREWHYTVDAAILEEEDSDDEDADWESSDERDADWEDSDEEDSDEEEDADWKSSDEEDTDWEVTDEDKATFGRKAYQDMFWAGFKGYQALFREQNTLIYQGTFVGRVAAALGRLPGSGPITLAMHDGFDEFGDKDITKFLLRTVDDCAAFSESMAKPTPWSIIKAVVSEEYDDTEISGCLANIAAAQLLEKLPVALHDVGVKLQGLHVWCDPLGAVSDCTGPEAMPVFWTDWGDLREACAELEVFSTSLKNDSRYNFDPLLTRRERRNQHSHAGAKVAGRLAAAALTSPKLENISCRWALDDNLTAALRSAHLEPTSLSLPELREFSISDIRVTRAVVEAILSAIGRQRIKRISMTNIHLIDGQSGSWRELMKYGILGRIRREWKRRGKILAYFKCER